MKLPPMVVLATDDTVTFDNITAEIETAGLSWEIRAIPNQEHPEGHVATFYVARVDSLGGYATASGFAPMAALLQEALRRYRIPLRDWGALYESTKVVTTAALRGRETQTPLVP